MGGSFALGFVCGAISGMFEFLRIGKVISAAKKEPFSLRKDLPKLMRERSAGTFFALRSTHIALFYCCFVGGQEISKQIVG